MCVHRIPLGVPLTLPPSHCYRCGQPIRWFDNIPLLSYWILRGRCRNCRARYSIRYFLVELATTLLFTGALFHCELPGGGYSWTFVPAAALGSLLLVATLTDIDHWIIPDRISLGGTVLGIALAAFPALGLAPHNPLRDPIALVEIPRAWQPLASSVAGAVTGYGLLWTVGFVGTMIFRREAMGMGDMKLAAMFGAFVGPLNCLLVLVIASFVGSVAGIAGILASRLSRAPEPGPAVAPSVPDADRAERLMSEAGLRGEERLVVSRALASPGSVTTARHHLPFGPWLAVAAFTVFLFWERIHRSIAF